MRNFIRQAAEMHSKAHIDVKLCTHPIGASFPLPVNLHVEIVKSISVKFDNPSDVAFVDLFVGSAATDRHAQLQRRYIESLRLR